MGKIANISIEYYKDNFDFVMIYKSFLSQKSVSYFDSSYYLVDFEPVEFKLKSNESMIDVLLDAIEKYKDKPLIFSVIYGDIITHHTINAVKYEELNIAISTPKMLKGLNVP
ncbi:MAG TPA: hypothetical protein ENK75_07300, partial [Saprospiraceae bacterium]|nr:hypothetical protein [Saprospiraceae bacterium]